MTAAAVLAIVSALIQGIPQIEAAVNALMALVQGTPLTPAQQQALGAAVEAAHLRVQALPTQAPAAQ